MYQDTSFRKREVLRLGVLAFLEEAHGKAAAISLNYLSENGGIIYDEGTNKWSIDFKNFEEGIRKLSKELLLLEGDGDNEGGHCG